MEFQQFYLSCLAHASYLIGSDGIAAVVDPQRDVDIYLKEAARRSLRIQHIIETHLHADFVSGHVELARRTGAKIYLGAQAGATFPHVAVKDGDEIRIGRAVLRFLETPGHTVESVCVLVTDLERSEKPWAALTGDTLFIGDVGRPDLSPAHTPQQLAALLYDSLHGKLLTLPDDVLVYPAHGAGSLCGRQMSTDLSSTIGLQRKLNYALRTDSKEEFVRLLTEDLPERPGYFLRDAAINRSGAPALSDLPPLPGLSPAAFDAQRSEGRIVLDTRPAAKYLPAHIPGSVQIALGGQFASWAGALLGVDARLLLVAEDFAAVAETRTRLARVGIEKLEGYLEGGILAWQKAGRPLETIPEISVEELHQKMRGGEDLQVLDVRRQGEWDSGHIAGAVLQPLNNLEKNLGGLDRARPLAVQCQGGYRSAIAASLLRRAGFRNIVNIAGGFSAWSACKLPVATASNAPAGH
ncbi:MAG: MBL fold metallo-hydrolase [Acidobacteriia bacterium]|nr:MBL fold metallo-hydrolase [Terriglobia bacterium]